MPQCTLNAITQLVEGAGAGPDRILTPQLQPALGGDGVTFRTEPRLKARLVTQLPQDHELTEQLALEDGLKVEFDVRGPGQCCRVTQQPEFEPIG